ncbi:hypothetical protein Gpo141_00002789 [Globisporangium polare]
MTAFTHTRCSQAFLLLACCLLLAVQAERDAGFPDASLLVNDSIRETPAGQSTTRRLDTGAVDGAALGVFAAHFFENDREVGCSGVPVADAFIMAPAACTRTHNLTRVTYKNASAAVKAVRYQPRANDSDSSTSGFAILELSSTIDPLGDSESAGDTRVKLALSTMIDAKTRLVRVQLDGTATMDWVEVLPTNQCDSEPLDFGWGRNASLQVRTQCAGAVNNASAAADSLRNVSSTERPRMAALLYPGTRARAPYLVGFQIAGSNRFVAVLEFALFINMNSLGRRWEKLLTKPLTPPHTDLSPSRYIVGVRITKDGQSFCSGTLIAPAIVLTAAHCVSPPELVKWVSVGTSSASDEDAFESIAVVPGSIRVHPEFEKLSTASYDAAIFEIAAPATARSITLDYSDDYTDKITATMTGFGRSIDEYEMGIPFAQSLQLPVWSRKRCINALAGSFVESMLCAGGQEGVDACNGDSGGPLTITDSQGNDVLIGLVSSGFSCGMRGIPGIYTRTGALVDFIQSYVPFVDWVHLGLGASSYVKDATTGRLKLVTPAPKVSTQSPDKTTSQDLKPVPTTSPPGAMSTAATTSTSSTPSSAVPTTPSTMATTASNNTSSIAAATDGSKTGISEAGQGQLVVLSTDLSPVVRDKVISIITGATTDTSNIQLGGVLVGLIDKSNSVTLYSTGDLSGLLRVIEDHSALPLNQRQDRFETIGNARQGDESKSCPV